MPNISQVNYEESSSIAKNLHTDGDDLVQLYSHTRQRMQALRSEWAGDAAEAFFEEMESELLPALKRVSGALFMGEEVLNKIMNIIHQADEETAGFFNSDLNDDFGAGLFGGALGGVIGGALGGAVGGEDFGAGQFENALDPSTTGQDTPPAGPVATEGTPAAASIAPAPEGTPAAETTPPAPETPPAADSGGGGGGGGGEGSQGMQGDLKGLGTGVGNNVQQVSSVGGGPQAMPDHVYEGSSGGSSGAGPAQGGPAGAGSPQEQSSGGSAGAAAGAAGVIGAAAAGAAKILKNDQNEPDK